MPPGALHQLAGASRLAVDATVGVAEVVEAMHREIGGGPRLLGRPLLPFLRLFSAPVYGAVRGVARLTGAAVELALAGAAALRGAGAPLEADAAVAVLNGILGDHLAATGNPLAIEASLRHEGEPLQLDPAALAARFPAAPRKLLVTLHGSCRVDRQRCLAGDDGLDALARDLACARIDLRYNTGLHVAENGRRCAALLERLVVGWPAPVEELALVGHSMGGLVARSAAHAAEAAGHAWRRRLRTLVCIASPHHGAPLERAGSWVDTLLGAAPYASPLARLGRLRSAGVTDLRFGSVLDEHRDPRGRFAATDDPRRALRLPEGVRCYAIAATRTADPGAHRPASDGLVPVASALGHHPRPELTLAFDGTWVAHGMGHIEVVERPETLTVIRRWLAG